VKFEVLFDESDGVTERAIKMLRKQLGELEKEYNGKTMVVDEEGQGGEGDSG
jgi:hypothetical protein